uniref:hypothetical protein n=1 Tax=Candidatus Enterococcus willemsii TaxID=1857215 RepID=UPI00403F1EAA
MNASDFQLSIEKKFDYMCRLVLINEKKNYYKQIKSLSDKEITFTDAGDYVIGQLATNDSYIVDNHCFTVLGVPIDLRSSILSFPSILT